MEMIVLLTTRAPTCSLEYPTRMDWPQIITAAKDVALGFSAVATASIAYAGLRRWRIELRGKADFEAAHALARATYKLRNAITIFRSPFVSAQEFPSSYAETRQRAPQQEADGWAHVYKARWEPLGLAIQEFDTQSLEVEALWGEPARARTEKLRECAKELNAAVHAFLDDKASGGENFGTDREFGARMRATVSGTDGDESNTFSQCIVSAVKGIEDHLRRHLAAK